MFVCFWQEEGEENVIENKETPVKEVEEEYIFFLLEEEENFDENKEPPLKKSEEE